MLPPSRKWSLYVGIYTFVCASVLVLALSRVATLVADLLVLPTDSALLLAGPVPVLGAVGWWTIVERPGTCTYLRGGTVGLVTGLLTVLFWVLRAAVVWGPEGVLAGWPLVFAVLVPTVPAALVTGVSAMYARRRLDAGGSTSGC